MTLRGGNTFGGPGSGLSSLANYCAGCVRMEALAPDVTFAAIDPVGDARRLRLVSGTSCFVSTVNLYGAEPFSEETTELRTRNVTQGTTNGRVSIDRTAIAVSQYVVGAEQFNGMPIATPCVAITANIIYAPPPPAPQPYFYVADASSGGNQVQLNLTVQAHVSGDWSVTATTSAPEDRGNIARLPILVAHAVGGFEGNSPGPYTFVDSNDPVVQAGFLGPPNINNFSLPSVKGEQKLFGCELLEFAWAQSSVAVPPQDWAFSGRAGGLGQHLVSNADDYQSGEPGLGHGVNIVKEGRTAHNLYGIRYASKAATYVSLTTTQVASVVGAVSSVISWHVPFIGNDYQKTATWTNAVRNEWPLYRHNYGSDALDLFCSPWTSRGTATALGSVVTFAHQLQTSDAAGPDSYFVGIGLASPPSLPSPLSGFTVSNAFFQSGAAGHYSLFAYPRILESTAPPHLPSVSSDVIDPEQCMHLSGGGIAGLNGAPGRVYMTNACSGQVMANASLDEGYVADRASAVPHGNRLQQRIADFNGCVRFTGASRHFTLPMNDASDVQSLIVTIALANPGLASLAIDSPLTRSSFLSTNSFFDELTQFSPTGYVSAQSLCGAFSLQKYSPAGNWLGCNRFAYVGEGVQQEATVSGSGLSQAPVHAGSVDGAYAFTLSKTCVSLSREGCFPVDSLEDPSEDCKQYFKLIRQKPFVYVKRYQYTLPYSTPEQFVVQEGFLIQYVADRVHLVEPDLANIFVGADWTFKQNKMAIHCHVSGNETYSPSYVNNAALQAVGGSSNELENRAHVRAKPLPVFGLDVTALCEARCHRVHFDKREIRRDYISTVVTSITGVSSEQFAPTYSGDRIGSESHDVDFGRSTYGVERRLSVACNEAEAEQFYAGEPVTLYWRIPPAASTTTQQLRGADAALYPALAITVQVG
jgi:hypothetical protein